MSKRKMLTTVLGTLSLCLLQACASSDLKPSEVKIELKVDAMGNPSGAVTGVWKPGSGFASHVTTLNASEFIATREVNPSHLSYTNGIKTGTLILSLANGSTVAYSGPLAYSTFWSNQIPPNDPSKQVLAFVPANASAVQAFINQYGSQAIEASYETKIVLHNDYEYGYLMSAVDTQFAYQGARAFAKRFTVRVGHRDGGPPVYLTGGAKGE